MHKGDTTMTTTEWNPLDADSPVGHRLLTRGAILFARCSSEHRTVRERRTAVDTFHGWAEGAAIALGFSHKDGLLLLLQDAHSQFKQDTGTAPNSEELADKLTALLVERQRRAAELEAALRDPAASTLRPRRHA